jgi:HK97 family phage prohead protease
MPTLDDLREVPAPVVERLGAFWTERDAPYRRGFDVVQRGRLLEVREATVELRAGDDELRPVIDGYATVCEYPYDVAGGPPYGWVETIAEGAATKTIRERDDVRLLANHEGLPLARTGARTLELESDPIGIRVSTPGGLDMRRGYVSDVVYALEDGDLSEMSMAFRVVKQEWNADYTERRILELKLYDVSVVTFPGNPATVALVRGDEPPVEPSAPGLSVRSARLELARVHQAGLRLS